MLRSSLRPHGPRAVLDPSYKMKCINLVHQPSACWAYFWNRGWDPARTTKMLDRAVEVSANTVKVACAGYAQSGIDPQFNDVAPTDFVLRNRMQSVWSEIRKRRLRLFYNIADKPQSIESGSFDADCATATKIAGWLMQDAGDLLALIDPVNEANLTDGRTSAASNEARMKAYFAAIRASTGDNVSLGFSTLVSSAADITTNEWIALQRKVCNHNDLHTYYQVGPDYTFDNIPQASHFANLEARSDFLGAHIIGEMGCGTRAGADIQTETYRQMGLTAQRRCSLGVNAFVVADYFPDDNYYGLFTADLVTPRPQIITPFRAFPGGQL